MVQNSKTCVKWPLAKIPQNGFQDQISLNAGGPSLSYHLSIRYLCFLFDCGRLTQVLLYHTIAIT